MPEAGDREAPASSEEDGNFLRTNAGKQQAEEALQKVGGKPMGLMWRTSSWYITTVVGLGVATDALAYNIVVPVLPYRLEALQYTNISTLTSWLLFAYSIGIFIFSFPVAYFFDRYPWRREPLVVAVIILEVALILFMLFTPYWVMVLSRFIQGAASTVIWSVGFALICENVEEKNIGRQMGWAISGVSVGTTIAPPIGGALYWKLGWKAPFIFTIIVCAVDLIARLLVIEQKDLAKWEVKAVEQVAKDEGRRLTAPSQGTEAGEEGATTRQAKLSYGATAEGSVSPAPTKTPEVQTYKKLSPLGVLVALVCSRRGVSAFLMTFIFGFILGALDPILTLRVQSIWHKDSAFVGLIYLIASAPTFVTGPIVGALADSYGAEWIMAPSLFLTLPWLPLLIIRSSLPAFITFFAMSQILLSCALGPTGLEVTMAARAVEGMSEIHQFAAINVAFASSSAIGAVAGGQMYNTLLDGWDAVLWLAFGLCALFTAVPFLFSGNRPLWSRIRERSKGLEREGLGPDEPLDSSSRSS